MAETISYHLKGILLGACNCDWGCPCNFESPPTHTYCEGSYLWHVQEGVYGQVPLNELNFSWCAHSPGPLHLGNVTSVYFIDERANAQQRQTLEEMLTRNPEIMPFGIFKHLTSTFLGVHYVPFAVELNGTHSRVTIPGVLDYQLTPMKNPVTGEEEPATLLKPKGFTSTQQDLCSTAALRLTSQGLSFDHSGKYGEFSLFEYPRSS
jgi:hypothetical protein